MQKLYQYFFWGGEAGVMEISSHKEYIKILLSCFYTIGYHGELFFRPRTRKVGPYSHQIGPTIFYVSLTVRLDTNV